MPQKGKPKTRNPDSNSSRLVVLGLCLGGFLLGAALVAGNISFADSPEQSRAEMSWYERVSAQATAVWSVITQTSQQILAGVPLQIAQVGSAPPINLGGGVPLPASGVTVAGAPLASLTGTLLINTPLEVDNTLQVFGTSSFATTTIAGPLALLASLSVAEGATFSTLTTDGAAILNALSVVTTADIGTLLVSGAGTFGSASVSGAVTAGSLSVTGNSAFADVLVSGSAELSGPLTATGLITANGGIDTAGADINLGSGSLFAANVVNQLIAGENVTITGTQNQPIISVSTDDLVGVLSVNGETGDIDLLGGTDITISGLTIFNNATLATVRGRGGCNGCINDADVSPILTITGGSIDGTAIGSTTAASARFTEVTIGTTTSSTTLTVGGGVAVSDILTVSGTATSTFSGSINLLSGCFAINGVCVEGIAPSSYVGLIDTPGSLLDNAIQFANASGTALTQVADFVFDNGRLGIGTSSPSDSLTVVGDMYLSGAFRDGLGFEGLDGNLLQSTGTSTRWVSAATFGDGTFLGLSDTPSTFATGSIPFVNAGATALTQSSGLVFDGSNLGVGTDTPLTRLSVVGGDVSIGGANAVRWYNGANSQYVGFRASTTLAATTVWTLPSTDGTLNQLLVTDGTGNLRFADVASIGAGATTYLELLDTPSTYATGSIPFVNASSTALSQSSTFVFRNGNLGLGVADPATRLTVEGGVRLQLTSSQLGLTYGANGNRFGFGTENPTEFVTIQNGSLAQRGGTVTSTYQPSAIASLPLLGNVEDVAIKGNFAYAVSSSGGNNFFVVDITNPLVPINVVSLSLPTGALSIEVAGQYAYVGGTFVGDGLFIVDITNPLSPSVVNSISVPTDVRDIIVSGQYAYVAVGNVLRVFNISNPATPFEVASTTVTDNINGLALSGTYMYAASAVGGTHFHVIDVSDPTTLSAPIANLNFGAAANDISIRGTYAYVVTSNSVNTLRVVNISNPAAPTLVTSLGLGTTGNTIKVAGRYAYVGTQAVGNTFYVLDIINPATPQIVGSRDLAAGNLLGMDIKGRYAYVVSSNINDRLHVVDTTGAELQSAMVHSLEGGYLFVQGDSQIAGRLVAGLGLRAGTEGLQTDGGLSVLGTGASQIAGRLSVGTSSSLYNLTVAGDIGLTGSLYDSFGSAGTLGMVLRSTSTGIEWVATSSLAFGGPALTLGTGNQVPFMNGGGTDFTYSSNMTFDGSVLDINGIIDASSRVRINTANNDRPLEVGSSLATGSILARFAQTGTDANAYSLVEITQQTATDSLAMLRFTNDADSWSIGTDGSDANKFKIANSGGTSFATPYFTIDTSGNVGIGTTTPSERLTVVGTIQSTALSGIGVADLETDAQGNIIRGPSDARLKQNIATIENPLEIILGLRGVRYEWIDTERFGAQMEVGFIAQEVQAVLPEVVREGDDYWSLRTGNIIAVVVEAIKSLWAELRGTQDDVIELRERVEELEAILGGSSQSATTDPNPSAPSVQGDEIDEVSEVIPAEVLVPIPSDDDTASSTAEEVTPPENVTANGEETSTETELVESSEAPESVLDTAVVPEIEE